jgi:hypothetical protein
MIRTLIIILCVICLSSCIVLPKETTDGNSCILETKKRTLEFKQINGVFVGGCSGDNCTAELIVLAAVPIGSALVSGSIVVVGNTIHWMEYQGRCPESFLNKAKQAFVDLYK